MAWTSDSSNPAKNQFEYQFAAKVTEQQQAKTGQGPSRSKGATPSESVTAPDQDRKHAPGYQRQNCMVNQAASGNIIEENKTADDGKAEEYKSRRQ